FMIAAQDAAHTSSLVQPAGRLQGKVALITNGTRGLGFAIAKAYVREGAKVVVAGTVASELKVALDDLSELGGDATATKIDLSSQAACEQLYNGALRSYGKIDILVNNSAVVGPMVPIVQYSGRDWDDVIRVNLDTVYWLSKAVLGSMIPSNGGSIINITAAVAQRGRAKWGAYSVAKAGVENLTQILAEENSIYNIRVNCVDPGALDEVASLDEVLNPFIYLAADVSKGATGLHLASSDWVGRRF
ncbi:MAG TPA: SDR family NAD(P)-dependent oxidoreductase, partial [Candidatus Sumerlaeota bacterium]|nr:SDR family NAD(P)-dependent oxidoreductase [Candidatus Sumerlaeota bacterium]